ncbi:hypothetical protein [Chitinophaga sp. YIM B06452]|uniref:hypothetical protein n=1 Tax=Chitinophaga sp. YIM B06452 TaxID=3082158 RepID=UPI0031FE65D4
MNFSVLRKQRWSLAVLFLLAAGLFVSCSKDNDPDPTPSGYPKEVTVTYKVTKVSGSMTQCRIDWFNESGGLTVEQNAAFPVTRTFKRTVNQYEYVGITAVTGGPGSIKIEVLVDNVVVDSKTNTGTTNGSFGGEAKYIFP